MLQFFGALSCLFPKRSAIFAAAQNFVYPVIQRLYDTKIAEFINQLQQMGPIHLEIDGQFDSPGYCAHHCIVSALESTTKKLIGFVTCTRARANNVSSNAETIATRDLINKLLVEELNISSITTDGSKALSNLIATEYPNIVHYLDLWHILRNLFRKLNPNFKVVCYFYF